MSGMANATHPAESHATGTRRRHRYGPRSVSRHIDLVAPERAELERVCNGIGLDPSAAKQLQDPNLAPGAVSLGRALIVRLNFPRWSRGEALVWRRVDVVLLRRAAITVRSEHLDVVDDPLERFRAQPSRHDAILARVTEAAVHTLVALTRELDANFHELSGPTAKASGPTGDGDTLPRLKEQVHEDRRMIRLLRNVLSRFESGGRDLRRTLSAPTRAELIGLRDRLVTLETEAEVLAQRVDELTSKIQGTEALLDVESPEIIETAAAIGERRLARLTPAHAITAIIGGMAVSFGALAMAWTAGPWLEELGLERARVLASLAFPLGLVILIIGKAELFTENFFVPVTSVWKRRGTIGDLASLWTLTLTFNLIGGLVFAFLASRPGMLEGGTRDFLVALAEDKVSRPFWPQLVKAIYGGWVMTLLTWLLLGVRSMAPRIAIIWGMGFLLSAGHFNHVVISAVEIFLGMFLGAPITVSSWWRANFVPSLLGNVLGGLVFVTLAGYLQALSLRAGQASRNEPVEPG
jgi:formate-nitrite transporter family protein